MEIVFEGINGSGKSTIIQSLFDELGASRDAKVIKMSDHKSSTSKSIKSLNIVRSEFIEDFILETALVACERRCDMNSLAAIEYDIALIERGVPGLFSFAKVRGVPKELVQSLISKLIPSYPSKRWVLVDIDPETAKNRLMKGAMHRFETYPTEWYNALRAEYLQYAQNEIEQALIINGADDPHKNAKKIIHEFL